MVTIVTEISGGTDGEGIRITETRTGTHPFRDNNPGDIRSGGFADRAGAIGSDSGIAIFPNSQTGFAALDRLLSAPTYVNLTIDQAIERFAPPNENDTKAYQAAVRTAVGTSGDHKLSALTTQQRNAMTSEIARHEGFFVPGTSSTTIARLPAL